MRVCENTRVHLMRVDMNCWARQVFFSNLAVLVLMDPNLMLALLLSLIPLPIAPAIAPPEARRRLYVIPIYFAFYLFF